MRIAWIGYQTLVVLTCLVAGVSPVYGADKEVKPAPISPGESLAEGWEDLDPRQRYLMERLVMVDTLLDALEQKQFQSYRKQQSERFKSQRADESIGRQYANGGGPVRWTKFYGRTIDAFYQPGASRAVAVLDGWGNVRAGAVTQGAPTMKKRPPQFDYIEKSQDKIKVDAAKEIDLLGKKMDQIDARRKELEAEQIKLWCQIAFREVQRRDLTQKPLYRFEPASLSIETDIAKQAESMRMAVILMSQVVGIIDKAEEDQAAALRRIAKSVKRARVNLTDTWLRQGVLDVTVTNDRPDLRYPRGRFIALTRLLEGHAANLDETYELALKDMESKVESKLDSKKKNWDDLMESLVRFAEVVLAMDETAIALAREWQVQPDLNRVLILDEPLLPKQESRQTPVPVAVPASVGPDLAGLKEIRLHKGKGKTEIRPVTHEAGVAYVKRGNGSKTLLNISNKEIWWKRDKGKVLKIDLASKKSNDGARAELVFGK